MIPEAIQTVLAQLEQAGFEAYAVGGCVRDTLLGRPVHDWDVTTSAKPEQVMALFPRCIATGLKHGTVTVLSRGWGVEVTTFRTDGAYSNSRSPDQVQFIRSLPEDLKRRDFTINAMAMDRNGRVTDLFCGREDLERKSIRCVGEAEVRFGEDALRMLRGIRFSAQLGFSIAEPTWQAMKACAHLCMGLSFERLRDEVEKTLLSDRPERVGWMIELGMLKRVGLEQAPPLQKLGGVKKERLARWAMFRRLVPQLELSDFRLDKRTVRVCTLAAGLYGESISTLQFKRIIAYTGWEVARCVAAMNGQEKLVQEIADSGDCVTLGQLAVKGDMLKDLEAQQIGMRLHRLLDYVLEHPEENTAEVLLPRVGGK